MPDLTLVLLGAGKSTRFNNKTKKQWIRVGDDPLWLFLSKKLQTYADFKKIIVVANKDEISYMKKYASYIYVKGGEERQISLKNALKKVETEFVLVTDIARACIDKKVIDNLISKKNSADIIVPYLDVSDTVHYQNKYINRGDVKLIQTPQLSKSTVLKEALNTTKIYTDDSSAIIENGGSIAYVKGSKKAVKLTFLSDLETLECLKASSKDIFSGIGYDVHPFEKNKEMFLCGVKIDFPFGFKAHSDGDVALHALMDAILGAAGAGDIGEIFPDCDEKYKDIDSKELLKEVKNFITKVGYDIVNVDLNIIAQKPKISPYKQKMREVLSNILNILQTKINIKATTTEGLGYIGRNEGVAVQVIASLKYSDWTLAKRPYE